MDETLDSYKRSLQLKPDAPEVWYNMAVLLQGRQRHEEALDAYYQVHKLGLETPESWYNIGCSLVQLGRLEEGVKAFDRCVAQSERFPEEVYGQAFQMTYAEACFNKGLTLVELGRVDDAIDAFDHALHVKPYFQEALQQKAQHLLAMGRNEEALEAWEQVLQRDLNSPDAWFVKSRILERLGRLDEAHDAHRRGLMLEETVGPSATFVADQPAAIHFCRHAPDDTPDGIGRVDFIVQGNVLFSVPHGPSACREVGFNELTFYIMKAMADLPEAGEASRGDSDPFSEMFLRLWKSLEKLEEEKRQAIMVRAIATVVAIHENEDVARFLETKPRGAYDSIVFAAGRARVRDNCTFDYDNLFEIADQRLTKISGDYETQKTVAALHALNVTAPIIIQSPGETPGELAERMANPAFYSEPPYYQPPSDALELLARYEGGERYFHATVINDCSMIEATLVGVNLNKSSLTNNNMRSSNLSDSHLIAANLTKTNLADSTCVNIRLMDASMREANLAYCNLQNARMRDADLEGADLRNANLTNASLSDANLKAADLSYADVTNAEFKGAKFDYANFENVKGRLWVDGNSIYRTRFSYNASDPWSTLCRLYTGIHLVYHLIFLCLFVGGHAVNIAYLVFLSEGQQMLGRAATQIDATLPTDGLLREIFARYLTANVEAGTVFAAAIGLAKGYGTVLLTSLLLIYNAGRWYLTKKVSLLKADQDKNNVLPRMRDYRRLYYLHRVFLVLMWVSGILFIVNLYGWLAMPLAVARG